MGKPLEPRLSPRHKAHLLGCGRLGNALADQDLAWAGAGGDPGGQIDGAAEVVATLDDHRPGRHPDMSRAAKMPSSTSRWTSASVTPARSASPDADSPFMSPSSQRAGDDTLRPLIGPITDEGVAVGGAFDSDTATGMMPAAQFVAGVLTSWRS